MCCTAIYDRTTALLHLPVQREHQPGDYEQGVIAHITRSSGTSRVTYIVENIVPPNNSDDVYLDGA